MKRILSRLAAAWLVVGQIFLLAPTVVAQSKVDQLTDQQIQDFVQKAQASGLTESQIEQAAVAQGLTPADVTRMRERIAGMSGGQKRPNTRDTDVVRQQQGELDRRTPPARRDSIVTNRDTTRRPAVFGSSFFNNATLTFEPNLRIPTPRGYVLGPDDELIVDIYGNASYTYKLRVSPEGTIRIENLAPIVVSGLTIEEARERIISRLRLAYSGLNRPGGGVTAQITLGSIRSIRVSITGEVVKPGRYTVSSLSTAFNALYQSGGPTENGSFRSIQVIRGNRVIRTIDLYDFLLRADQKDNILLQDDDIIRVPDYEAKVELTGEVRRPMTYEVKRGETLRNVLGFAGGFTDQAYTATLTLRRNTPRERRVANLSPDELAAFVPLNGDRVTVGKILSRFENQVQVLGAVFRPGEYAIEPGTSTVRELIGKAEGLREDAFLGRAILRREGVNLDATNIAFDLGKIMRGEAPDIALQRQDVITVTPLSELRETYAITITGAVNRGGRYAYADSMRVADLIVQAGGFAESASPSRVEVARRLKDDTTGINSAQSVRLFRFDLDQNLRLRAQDAGFALKPFDVVYVRSDPRYEAQRQVIITGEVLYPGSYAIREKSERIADLIQRAGGLRPEAFLRAARFIRRGELVALDLREILDRPDSEANLLLRDGDSLEIPKKTELVRIQGAVLNPATVNFQRNFELRNYISRSGGFTERAIRRKVFVTYANGEVDRTRNVLFIKQFPRMEPGATISVPTRPVRDQNGRLSPGERVGLYSLFGSLVIAIATVITRLNP
ncbi:MAG: SLBB domain-containing protein [Cytophagaceae bacterium]|nr:SLBB domain-containing protein [Cytophagaceae bacterium]